MYIPCKDNCGCLYIENETTTKFSWKVYLTKLNGVPARIFRKINADRTRLDEFSLSNPPEKSIHIEVNEIKSLGKFLTIYYVEFIIRGYSSVPFPRPLTSKTPVRCSLSDGPRGWRKEAHRDVRSNVHRPAIRSVHLLKVQLHSRQLT